MATHQISKFRFNKSINKEQIKLLKQQLNDKNLQDSQINDSQFVLTNLTKQFQKLNSQSLNFNSIFQEIQELKPFKYNKYRTLSTHNLDQSLTRILQKLQQKTSNQHEINKNTQNNRKQSQPHLQYQSQRSE